jgi:hypothetical protein
MKVVSILDVLSEIDLGRTGFDLIGEPRSGGGADGGVGGPPNRPSLRVNPALIVNPGTFLVVALSDFTSLARGVSFLVQDGNGIDIFVNPCMGVSLRDDFANPDPVLEVWNGDSFLSHARKVPAEKGQTKQDENPFPFWHRQISSRRKCMSVRLGTTRKNARTGPANRVMLLSVIRLSASFCVHIGASVAVFISDKPKALD